MITRLPNQFDVSRLEADLALVRDDEWISHYNSDDYEGRWDLAALRSPAGMQDNVYSSAIPEICVATPLLNRCSYFKAVLDSLPLRMSSVRLMKLDPGAVIKEHSDSFGDDEVRIHIAITTNNDVEFFLDGSRVQMPAGTCWLLDFRLPHRVANHGVTSRTHIVIDAYCNDWLEAQQNRT